MSNDAALFFSFSSRSGALFSDTVRKGDEKQTLSSLLYQFVNRFDGAPPRGSKHRDAIRDAAEYQSLDLFKV